MDFSTVTSKGQVVIPATLRRRFGIRAGTRVCFLPSGRDLLLRPITDEYIESVRGSLHSGGRVLKALLAVKRREREP